MDLSVLSLSTLTDLTQKFRAGGAQCVDLATGVLDLPTTLRNSNWRIFSASSIWLTSSVLPVYR